MRSEWLSLREGHTSSQSGIVRLCEGDCAGAFSQHEENCAGAFSKNEEDCAGAFVRANSGRWSGSLPSLAHGLRRAECRTLIKCIFTRRESTSDRLQVCNRDERRIVNALLSALTFTEIRRCSLSHSGLYQHSSDAEQLERHRDSSDLSSTCCTAFQQVTHLPSMRLVHILI
jgi:hypothetical protein